MNSYNKVFRSLQRSLPWNVKIFTFIPLLTIKAWYTVSLVKCVFEYRYNLTIKAEDFGGRFSTVVVVVQITDTNDNSPQFGDGLDRTCTTRVSIEEVSYVF